MFTKEFLMDLGERVVATYLQAFIGLLIASGFADDGKLNMGTATAAAVSALPAVLALIKGIIALKVGDEGTAALLPAEVDTESNFSG